MQRGAGGGARKNKSPLTCTQPNLNTAPPTTTASHTPTPSPLLAPPSAPPLPRPPPLPPQMRDKSSLVYRSRDAVRWLTQVAQGLKYLHRAQPQVEGGE